MRVLSIGLFILILVALPTVCLGQFSGYTFTTPHRFDELGWGAGNNTRGEKCIDLFGSNIYIVAEANGGSSTMQCNRSTDGGTSWDTLAGLGWSDSRYLSLSVDEGGRVYLTWFYHNATFNGLCKTAALYGNSFLSTGTGNTWIDWYSNLWFAGAASVSAKGTGEGNPLICASQESFDGTQNYEITLDCPLAPMAWDNFNYWNGPPYHDDYLTFGIPKQIRPCVRLDDANYVHIVWEDNNSGNRIAFRRSSNVLSSGGPWPLTWNSLIYIEDSGHNTKGTTTGYVQGHSQMIVTGSGSNATVYVVWVASDNNIYLDKSTDGGASWGTDVRVNDDIAATREWPSLSMDGSGNLYFVWMDNRDGNNNIYFSYSTDGGSTFSPDTCVHNGTPDDKYPGIAAGQETDALSEVHIAWTRVDTTMYAKGTPVPVGVADVNLIARCHENGILVSWNKQGYLQTRISGLFRRECHQHYTEIERFVVQPFINEYTYYDTDVQPAKMYFYKLVLMDVHGNALAKRETSANTYSMSKELSLSVLSNPSREATIYYAVKQGSEDISLRIVDSGGRIVKTFSLISAMDSGTIIWNGKDGKNSQCPAGVYFVILSSGKQERAAKFILLR